MRRRIGVIAGEVAFVGLLGALIVLMAVTIHENLAKHNIATGFGFLFRETGWDVGSALIAHSARDPYWWTFLVGLLNTVALATTAVVLSTITGILVALLRVLENKLLSTLINVYISVFRNIPLIVQIFFWYAATRQLPTNRAAIVFFGGFYLSNRGLFVPSIAPEWRDWAFLALTGAIAYAVFGRRGAGHQWSTLGKLASVASGAVLAFLLLDPHAPTVSLPHLAGFNFVGGFSIQPELVALIVAIVIYNTTFIAEIVRAGLQSVPVGQTEAAQIIGLKQSRIFWKVVMPQAIRVIVPPLINQYSNITKASALAVAIGFTDLFSIGTITINHTGQAIEVIMVLMLAYLTINALISLAGNIYDRSIRRHWQR